MAVAVLGVDGWRGRWVGAVLEARSVRLLVLQAVTAALAVPDVELIAIDMPNGLSDDGARACDVAARSRLARAGSSVFPLPCAPCCTPSTTRTRAGSRSLRPARRSPGRRGT